MTRKKISLKEAQEYAKACALLTLDHVCDDLEGVFIECIKEGTHKSTGVGALLDYMKRLKTRQKETIEKGISCAPKKNEKKKNKR